MTERRTCRIFLAGVMQGSLPRAEMVDQSYRQSIADLLSAALPEAQVHDPLANHRSSVTYDDATGCRVFLEHNAMCSEVDVVIAYVPTASMGTAIEMWEAHRHGRLVLTISPLVHNWTIKFLSDRVYPRWEDFEEAVASGEVASLIRSRMAAPVAAIALEAS
jgi:hypothetical protein